VKSVLYKNKIALASLVVIGLIFVVAVFAPLLAPYAYDAQNSDALLASPSAAHWLGTDNLGRDLLSRLIYGSRVSVAIAVVTALISVFVGGLYGAMAGWVGGTTDAIMMRLVDIVSALPSVVILILISTVMAAQNFGEATEVKAVIGILIALSLVGWMTLARLVRGQVLQIKTMPYIEAARALGASTPSLLWRHVRPNIMGPMIVLLTYQIPANILFESFLSFLGLGLQPPYSSWGVLASDGWRAHSYPHLILGPGMAIFILVLSFNLLGDGLRDAADPHLKTKR
jgi:oligopeptide transport system permease protein